MRLNHIVLNLLILIIGFLSSQNINAQNFDLEQANRAYTQQNYDEAITWADRVIEKEPTNLPAIQIKAGSLLATDQLLEAQNTAEIGLEENPDHTVLTWFKAEALLQRGLLEEALKDYQKLLNIPSELQESDIRLRLGMIYQSLGIQTYQQDKFDEALDYFKSTKTYMPDSLASYSNLALTYIKKNDWENALKYIDEGREIFPESEDLRNMRVHVLYEQRNFKEVLTEYEELYERNPENLDNALTYAELLLAQSRNEESEAIYEKLLDKHPKERKIYESLISFYRNRGSISAQRDGLRLMLEQFQDDADIMRRIAQTYVDEEKWENAHAAYDSAFAFGGDIAELTIFKADAYIQQDSLENAHQQYENTLQNEPNNVELLSLKGDIEEKLNNWDGALKTYKTMLSVEESARNYENIARVYHNMGNAEKAIQNYEIAANNNTKSAIVYHRLANYYIRDGDNEKAYNIALKALKTSLKNLNQLQENLTEQLQTESNLGELENTEEMAGGINENNQVAEDSFKFLTTHFNISKLKIQFDNLLEEYARSGKLYYMIGRYYIKLNQEDEGLYLVEKSVEYTPTLSEAHVELGDYYYKNNEIKAANLSYERAISTNPDNKTAYKKLINLHQNQDTLNQLSDRWKARLRVKSNQPVLKEFLIEALHKANRFEEASEIINKY